MKRGENMRKKDRPPLTVAQLIALLEKLPDADQSRLVSLEGCDCVGEAVGLGRIGQDVLIERNP